MMDVEKILAALAAMSPTERDQARSNWEKARLSDNTAMRLAAEKLIEGWHQLEADEAAAHNLLPVAERVRKAFAKKPTVTERKVVQALLDNPGATSEKLSTAAGWKGNAWHLHFGTMCSNRSNDLWKGPRSERRDAEFYSGILADYDDASSGFTMKPDVVQAFQSLGFEPVQK